MTKMLRRGAVLDLISDGINAATPVWLKIYKDHLAPEQQRQRYNEQFFSSFIAHELQKSAAKLGGFCTHETSHFALESAVARAKIREGKASLNNRYDLVLWRNRSSRPVPYALIEVKLDYRFHSIMNDAVKVCKALQSLGTCSNGTLKNVYLAFPAADRERITAAEGVEDAIDKIDKYLHGEKIETKSKSSQINPLLKDDKHIEYLPPEDGKPRSAAVVRISSQMVIPAK